MGHKCIMLGEKKQFSKGHIPCDFIYTTFTKDQNYKDGEEITDRCGVRRLDSMEIFVMME